MIFVNISQVLFSADLNMHGNALNGRIEVLLKRWIETYRMSGSLSLSKRLRKEDLTCELSPN